MGEDLGSERRIGDSDLNCLWNRLYRTRNHMSTRYTIRTINMRRPRMVARRARSYIHRGISHRQLYRGLEESLPPLCAPDNSRSPVTILLWPLTYRINVSQGGLIGWVQGDNGQQVCSRLSCQFCSGSRCVADHIVTWVIVLSAAVFNVERQCGVCHCGNGAVVYRWDFNIKKDNPEIW